MKTNFMPKRRWMIVDDNAEILAMMRDLLLASTDADVESFNSPQTALAAFAMEPDAFELVITDFEMPGMNGAELCRAVRDIAPGQKVFLATGSGFFTDEAAGRAGFSGLLHKPFPLAAFQELLAANGLGEPQLAAA